MPSLTTAEMSFATKLLATAADAMLEAHALGMTPSPTYAFFADRDEHEQQLDSMRAALLPVRHPSIEAWIAHGIAMASITRARAVGLVAPATALPPEMTEAMKAGGAIDPGETIPGVLVWYMDADGVMLILHPIKRDQGRMFFDEAKVIGVPADFLCGKNFVFPAIIPPSFTPTEREQHDVRAIIEQFGGPVWITEPELDAALKRMKDAEQAAPGAAS